MRLLPQRLQENREGYLRCPSWTHLDLSLPSGLSLSKPLQALCFQVPSTQPSAAGVPSVHGLGLAHSFSEPGRWVQAGLDLSAWLPTGLRGESCQRWFSAPSGVHMCELQLPHPGPHLRTILCEGGSGREAAHQQRPFGPTSLTVRTFITSSSFRPQPVGPSQHFTIKLMIFFFSF